MQAEPVRPLVAPVRLELVTIFVMVLPLMLKDAVVLEVVDVKIPLALPAPVPIEAKFRISLFV